MSVQDRSTTVRLTLEDGYRFRADFGPDLPALVMDEPAPLGSGSGPNAAALLGAAVGNCLGASLLIAYDAPTWTSRICRRRWTSAWIGIATNTCAWGQST